MSSQLVEACDLIQKKCKEMEINFLKHQCINFQPLVVGDTVAKQVDNYKLLGVYIPGISIFEGYSGVTPSYTG